MRRRLALPCPEPIRVGGGRGVVIYHAESEGNLPRSRGMKKLGCLLILLLLAAALGVPQTGDLAPGENLVVEGVPRIPAALAAAVSRYAEFRAATLMSWHPTRREMLISTRFGDTPQVHLVKFPGGARRQLTFFPDRVSDATFHPKGGDYFVFSKDVGGSEWFQKYRFDLATGAITLLTDGKSRNVGGVWSNDGNRLAYGSTRRNGADVDLYVLDPAAPERDRRLAELNGGGWTALDWSPDDRRVLVEEYVSANESYLWLFDAATGERALLTPKGGAEKASYGGGQFSKDGKGLYVTTDRESEFHLLDTATRAEKSVPGLPLGLISGLHWHLTGTLLGFNLVSARSTSDVYSLEVGTGKVERWTESETGGLNTESFSQPELVRWKSFDGRTISGFLYRPPARFTGKRPVAINIHGGPEGQFRPGFLGRNNYFLNEMGVAIIYPNVRGSTGYGKTFLALDNGLLREGTYKDINALFDWIATRPDLDAERVMVTGGSYGGHMTLAVITYYPERLRCALSVVGIGNLVTLLEHTESYRRDLRRAEYGDERDPKMREFLERIAPVNNAGKIRRPLLIVAGQNDPRVPVSEAEQMVAAVRKTGTPVWYLMAKDEGHGFAKKKNQDFLFYSTVAFMQEYLLK